ncbi:DUF4278 domain-containing protein [Pannus brasiliensis CCIBt3594]|uniref:DUF4278 domain-containing protein n=1 Tax=Pannus brasiliensis CCIBt3594 TaxID=1427578 RepID=A0AAW9QQ14_9CHRO
MPYLFLLPLCLAVGMVYLARNSSDEIAYLSTLVAVGSLLFSLILAPWEIQLLILIAVVAIVTVLWKRSGEEGEGAIESPVEETTGEKIYRGVSYTETPAEEVPEIEVEGKYRGASVKISNTRSIAAPIRSSALKYRGASVAGDGETE